VLYFSCIYLYSLFKFELKTEHAPNLSCLGVIDWHINTFRECLSYVLTLSWWTLDCHTIRASKHSCCTFINMDFCCCLKWFFGWCDNCGEDTSFEFLTLPNLFTYLLLPAHSSILLLAVHHVLLSPVSVICWWHIILKGSGCPNLSGCWHQHTLAILFFLSFLQKSINKFNRCFLLWLQFVFVPDKMGTPQLHPLFTSWPYISSSASCWHWLTMDTMVLFNIVHVLGP
jgi:hypothetical protein